MKNLTFVQYPLCGTCRKAAKWLKENSIEFESRHIVEKNPNEKELTKWIGISNIPAIKFFNTSGKLYKELNLKDKVKTASKEELIELLASNGMLVKRPLLIGDNFVLVGFKEEEWAKQLK